MNRLPDKPGDLVRLAAMDFFDISRNPKYKITMNLWHRPQRYRNKEICHVCIAGSVIAGTLGGPIGLRIHPKCFDFDTKLKLDALDSLRSGMIDAFFCNLNYIFKKFIHSQIATSVPVQFFRKTEWKIEKY